MKAQFKKLLIINILFIICVNFLEFNLISVNASEKKPTLWVKIHRIKKIDEIEITWLLENGADWHYYICIYNGEEWLYTDKIYNQDDDIIINDIYTYDVERYYITIYIYLLEDDSASNPDVADISGGAGGGYDNYDGTLPLGAQYVGIYDLKTNTLTGNTYIIESGYYKTSGEYDGSESIDENDAELWFDIYDNYDAPVANAGIDQIVMLGKGVNFDGSDSTSSIGSSIVKYQWDFQSNGNYDAQGVQTSNVYSEEGVYTVTLKITDSIGEIATDTCKITVVTPPNPIANAGSDQTTKVGERVDFDGSGSRAASGATITRYQWDFDNDGIFDSEGENTFWTYDSEGTYIVKLKVTDNYDKTDTDICYVRVYQQKPQASFTYTPSEITIRDTVYFYDTSTDPDGSIVLWNWNFGDGFTSTLKDPTHKYADKSSYKVKLTVKDNDGNSDSDTKTITIKNLPPTAIFTYSPSTPKVGADIQFTDKSTDPEGRNLKYLWDFGDGFTSTTQNPKHQYTTSGLKSVKLTVTDDEGMEGFMRTKITISTNPKPSADFSYSPENQKMNHGVQFTDESKDDGYIVGWLWDFGDGKTSTQENPTHTYTKGGEYTVRLTVTDDNSDDDDRTKKISIIQTYDLIVQVKDILGLNIANAEIEVYDGGKCYASGTTDSSGMVSLTEIPEGNYEIRAKVLGVSTSSTCSLTRSKTEETRVAVSLNTVGAIGGVIILLALAIFSLKRKKKTSPPVVETKIEEEVAPVEEDVSLEEKKKELERERITDILQTFKDSFDKGEMDEETYLRLKKKYEDELKRLG